MSIHVASNATLIPRKINSGMLMSIVAPFILKVACPAGFEPATYGLEIRCSIQLN